MHVYILAPSVYVNSQHKHPTGLLLKGVGVATPNHHIPQHLIPNICALIYGVGLPPSHRVQQRCFWVPQNLIRATYRQIRADTPPTTQTYLRNRLLRQILFLICRRLTHSVRLCVAVVVIIVCALY